MNRSVLARSIALALAGPASLALPVAGHASPGATALEEVMVTARKRNESLQDVPMAVSAFSAEQMRNSQVNDITDLERFTPNVTLGDTGGLIAGVFQAFIRGIGNDPGFETGVGVYIDDIFINGGAGGLMQVYSVDRVEVLKGPQGNLYGRNTIGGAIKYVTKAPGNEFDASAAVRIGEYDLTELKADVSGPLVEDTLFGGVGVMVKERDGIQKNVFDGKNYWSEDTLAARGALVYKPADSVELKFSADYSQERPDPRIPARIAADGYTLGRIDFLTSGANLFFGPGTGVVNSPNDTTVLKDIDSASSEFGHAFDDFNLETTAVAFTALWDINERWTLKSVTANREVKMIQAFDFDGGPQQFITTSRDNKTQDLSQEFQLNYTSSTVNAVAGLYYLDNDEDYQNHTFQYPRLLAVRNQFKDTYVDDRMLESTSVYGNVDWDFAKQWQLSLGGRFTHDKREETQRATRVDGLYALARVNGLPARATLAIAPGMESIVEASPLFAGWVANSRYLEVTRPENTDASASWSDFTPSARIAYRMNDDMMFYAGYSSGFKSGGFQRNSGVATEFDPEYVDTLSLGMKSTFLDGRLRLNMEAFYNDYTDKQLSSIILENNDLTEKVTNVGEASTSGAEVELLWAPDIEGLQVGFNVGYLNAEIDSFESLECTDSRDPSTCAPTDLAGVTELGFSPEWTAQANIQYEIPLDGIGSLMLGSELSYRTKSYTNSPVDTRETYAEAQLQKEHVIVNAMVAFTTQDEHWRIAVEGRNLDNERVLTSTASPVPMFLTGSYNMPRTWAVSVAYNY